MSKPRPYPFAGSEAGVFHRVSRAAGREFIMGDRVGRDRMRQVLFAYAELLGVRVLTYCLMSNHFHVLVQVPHRPECDAVGPGTGPDLATILARLERAVGRMQMKLIRAQLEMWERAGYVDLIEEWRQRQVSRMYSLQWFMRLVKQRFARWYNATTKRTGVVWESRFTSVIVQDEMRALRTMATYIDLNPVRAGVVEDPADYEWSGYAEAMRGEIAAQQNLARIVNGGAMDRDWTHGSTRAGRLRALVSYRHLLGLAGMPRKRGDGTIVRRGVPGKVAAKLADPKGGGVRAEVVRRRVRHFSRGVIFGSRAFVDEWFTRNRDCQCRGRSREERESGARSMGRPGLRGLYTLRSLGAGQE